MASEHLESDRRWKLPPLILHPFCHPAAPEKLLASSRASLMLQGLIPAEDVPSEQLERSLLDGRYCELSMLFYIGKDLLRWAQQCVELVERASELEGADIRMESFTHLLVSGPPEAVDRKLRTWGVHEYPAIFARALGLNAVFSVLPSREALTADFIRHYHRYADQMFVCSERLFRWASLTAVNFDFEVYASGEYTRLLEKEWGTA